MANLNWNRNSMGTGMNSDYWKNPKTGFDRKWHEEKAALNSKLGAHRTHNWTPVQAESGPHAGKAICNTCGGKFIMWLPKGYFNKD
jgi:hypothetical protein